MICNHQYFNFCSFILFTAFLSSSCTTFCSDLALTDDEDTPCFLESPTHNPARLRSAGNSLVLPCHVARSKRSSIEWWYQDFQKLVSIKIYPVFPPVRPTVLRFITSASPVSKNSNETDIMDVSILLRHINIDDSGIYQCVIRPWTPTQVNSMDDNMQEDNSNLPTLTYNVELTAPRLCQTSTGALPCFSNIRTSSPTVIDAYQTAFLQCVVQNHNRPITVFWVVGNASVNSVLITDYLSTNQLHGDRLRRVFPLSPFDYSIELTVNRETRERTYSCVIDGATDVETTLFTYVIRSIDFEEISDKSTATRKTEVKKVDESSKDKLPVKANKIVAHDALTPQQIDELKQKNVPEHNKKKEQDSNDEDDEDFLLGIDRREETSKTD